MDINKLIELMKKEIEEEEPHPYISGYEAAIRFVERERTEEKDMNINETVGTCHEIAKSKGWWDSERNTGELHMLMVTEIAEATEEYRSNRPAIYLAGDEPCGEAIELADVVIRIFDYFGHNGWDMEEALTMKIEYNKTRPYRHGGKKA